MFSSQDFDLVSQTIDKHASAIKAKIMQQSHLIPLNRFKEMKRNEEFKYLKSDYQPDK